MFNPFPHPPAPTPAHEPNCTRSTWYLCGPSFGRHVRCRSSLDLDWETKIGQGQPVFSSPFFAALPCEGCGLLLPLVFVCSVPGLVAVLNLSNGMIVGQIQLPGEVFSSAVVAGRSLVVGCRDNNLYGIDITSKCSRCGYTY